MSWLRGLYPNFNHHAVPQRVRRKDPPLVGYRAWLSPNENVLLPLHVRCCDSCAYNDLDRTICVHGIRPHELRPAVCAVYWGATRPHNTGQTTPARDCTCGYHAVKTPADLLSWIAPSILRAFSSSIVIARAEIGGRIVEHEGGYRAEYIYPAVLFYSITNSHSRIFNLADRFGVEAAPMPLELAIGLYGFTSILP